MTRWAAIRAGLICTVLLSACSWFGIGHQQPAVTIHVHAAPLINPNAIGEATPVAWRVYQLSRRDYFDQADFLLLFGDDLSVLKGSLLNRQMPGSVLPASQHTMTFPLARGASYLGVMVAFSNYPDAINKGVIALKPDRHNQVRLDIDNITARLTTMK